MKKFFILSFLAIFISKAEFAWSRAPQIDSLSSIPLGPVKAPAVSIQTLSNGMKVYLLEDHELPLIQAFAYIRAGSIYVPADKLGLASILGSVLRTGGTRQKKVREIDRLLENKGASIETGMETEYGSASLNCLSKDASVLFPLFFEILSSPNFSEDQIHQAVARKIEALKRSNDEPEKIAVREYPQLLYGKNSVWARIPSSKSLLSLTREDLQTYHRRFYHPDRLILAIAGDFQKEEILKLLERSTEHWTKSSEPLPVVLPLEKKWEKGIYLMNKTGEQSTLLVGHFGEKRTNPDKFALILMNYMLGGDIFSSRLGEEVRSNRGLAYSIFSKFGLDTDYGLFYAMAQTKTDSTAEVIELIEKEIRYFHEGKGLTAHSLEFAKSAILNQLMGDWDPHFGYVKERARLSYFGYPEDYLDFFQKKLSGITLAQVKEVAHRYLFPDQLKILVVGEGAQIEASLKKLGEVKELPLPQF